MARMTRFVSTLLMVCVLTFSTLTITAHATELSLEWTAFTDRWAITKVTDLGIRPTPKGIMEFVFSPSRQEGGAAEAISTLQLGDMLEPLDKSIIATEDGTEIHGTALYQLTTYLSPDLKVPEEEIYSSITIPRHVDDQEMKYRYLDYATRPLKAGEFVHVTTEEYAHFYLIEQTCFRTGTANRLDTTGNVVEGDVLLTDEIMEVSNAWIAVGVEPGARMNYYQLLHEDDLQKVLENPLADVPISLVESEYFMYQDGAYRAFSVTNRDIGSTAGSVTTKSSSVPVESVNP